MPELGPEHLIERLGAIAASAFPEDLEREGYALLVETLSQAGLRKNTGLQEKLAEILGVSPSTISRRLSKYGLA